MIALTLLLAPMAASADQLMCQFSDGLDISFSIDRNQFAPALDPGEPPRRKVSTVRIGTQSVMAEPILMAGGVRGFWTDDAGVGGHMLTTNPGGQATYTSPDGGSLDGICEDVA